jgi:type VI secretion system protein ImpK
VPAQTLGRLAGDYFATVLLVAEAPEGESVEPAALRSHLVRQLDHLSAQPEAQALEATELDDIRFALVVWADEALMLSNWPGRNDWAQELLQLQMFRTNRGGDEFYDRLNRLRPEHNAARLIYFLCMTFGFRGQLMGHDPEHRALVQQHYDMLRASGHAKDLISRGQLTPEAYQLEVQLEAPSSGGVGRILLFWGATAAAIFAVTWGILTLLASRVPVPPGV